MRPTGRYPYPSARPAIPANSIPRRKCSCARPTNSSARHSGCRSARNRSSTAASSSTACPPHAAADRMSRSSCTRVRAGSATAGHRSRARRSNRSVRRRRRPRRLHAAPIDRRARPDRPAGSGRPGRSPDPRPDSGSDLGPANNRCIARPFLRRQAVDQHFRQQGMREPVPVRSRCAAPRRRPTRAAAAAPPRGIDLLRHRGELRRRLRLTAHCHDPVSFPGRADIPRHCRASASRNSDGRCGGRPAASGGRSRTRRLARYGLPAARACTSSIRDSCGGRPTRRRSARECPPDRAGPGAVPEAGQPPHVGQPAQQPVLAVAGAQGDDTASRRSGRPART